MLTAASNAWRRRYRLAVRVCLATAVALAAVSPARAQEDTAFPGWEFSIRTDNDTLLNSDRYYSNGLWLTALKTQGDRWFGWAIGNETYTGAQISLTPEQIPADDRPYAGWTYVSHFRGRLQDDGSSVIWEFGAGCIGPCSNAQRFQDFWHSNVVDVPEAQGWPAQIEDEIGLQVRRVRQKPLRHWLGDDGGLRADLERTTEFRIGNIFTDATIGIIGRYGLGNMRGYYDGAGLDDMTPKRPVTREDHEPPGWVDRPGRAWLGADEAFLFGRVEASLVARNSTIQGGVFNENSLFTQDIRHGVIHTEIGFKLVWRRLTFAMSWNSISTDWVGPSWDLNQHNWISFFGVVH